MNNQINTPKYIEFLSNHPACVTDIQNDIFSAGCFWTYNCSKEGRTELDPIHVYRNDPKFEKFKHKFKKSDDYVLVSYKEYYNKKWVYDYTNYGGEVCFHIFDGKFDIYKLSHTDWKKWGAYQGVSAKGKTFDEMIEGLYKKVLEKFGNFCNYDDSMLTTNEIENHKKERCFSRKPVKLSNGETGFQLINNPKYLTVNNAILNRRWLRWYSETEDCRKNWGDRFVKMVQKTPDWVWDVTKK